MKLFQTVMSLLAIVLGMTREAEATGESQPVIMHTALGDFKVQFVNPASKGAALLREFDKA